MKVLKTALVAILVLLVLLVGGTALWTVLTRKNLQDALPTDVSVYVEIPSLRQVYADWLPLDATDMLLSSPGMENARALLADWRQQSWADHPTLGSLLELPAGIVLTKTGTWMAAFDLGWRSAFTRWVNLLGSLWIPDGLGLYRQAGRSLYFWQQGEDRIYILLLDNLVIVSNRAEDLGKVFAPGTEATQIPEVHSWPDLQAGSQVRFLLQPQPLIKDLDTGPDSWIRWMIDEKLLPLWASGAVRLDNRGLESAFRTSLPTEDREIQSLLLNKPAPLQGMKRLPESTILASALNLADLPVLLQIWSSFDPSLEEKITAAENGLQTAFGKGLDELIYSWLGREWGVAFLEGQAQPALWLEVRDQGAFDRSMTALEESWALDSDQRLVVDGLRLRRLSIPGYLQPLLALFNVELPTAYLWVQNGLVWISLDPSVLSRINQGLVEGKTLGNNPEYRELTADHDAPALAAYYDLNKRTPWFLRSRQIWSRVLGLYAKGWVQAGPQNGDWELRWSSRLSRPSGWAPAPGFPRPWEGDPEAPWWYGPSRLGPQIRTVQREDRNTLVFSDPSGLERKTIVLPPGTDYRLWVKDLKLEGVWVWSSEGEVTLYAPDGLPLEGFPLPTAEGPSEPGLGPEGSLWFSAQGQWYRITPQGQVETGVLPFDGPVVHSPVVRDEGVWWYQRSFNGSLWGLYPPGHPQSGQVMPGWPVENLPLSSTGPQTLGPYVGQISTSGVLTLWKTDGTAEQGYPVDLDGSFRRPILYVEIKGSPGVGLVNDAGRVTFLSLQADQIIAWNDGPGKSGDQWTAARELLGEKPALVVYGSSQFLRGRTWDGSDLEGFPLQGFGAPRLMDLNGDGQPEILSPGLDRKLYAHQWYGRTDR